MESAGYVDVEVRTIVNQYPLDYWLRLLPLPAGIKTSLTRLANRIGLGSLALPMPAGNLAVVGFKP